MRHVPQEQTDRTTITGLSGAFFLDANQQRAMMMPGSRRLGGPHAGRANCRGCGRVRPLGSRNDHPPPRLSPLPITRHRRHELRLPSASVASSIRVEAHRQVCIRRVLHLLPVRFNLVLGLEYAPQCLRCDQASHPTAIPGWHFACHLVLLCIRSVAIAYGSDSTPVAGLHIFGYRTTGNVWQTVKIGMVQSNGKDWQRPYINRTSKY
jgi:hypothetical protein